MTKQYLQLADAIDASTKTTGFERNCASAIRALVVQIEVLKQQVTVQHMVALRAAQAQPDTHCFDDDTGKDVWSYSEAQLKQAVQDALKEASAALAQPEPVSPVLNKQMLWLWKNGDHYLAFDNLYPCFTQGGDPMTLGEPAARAIFRTSFAAAKGGV